MDKIDKKMENFNRKLESTQKKNHVDILKLKNMSKTKNFLAGFNCERTGLVNPKTGQQKTFELKDNENGEWKELNQSVRNKRDINDLTYPYEIEIPEG